MKQAPEHLINLLEPIVEGLGYECVGIEYNPHPRHGMLRIYIDSENGILLDDCTKVSHQVSGVLDVEDPIAGNYQLEISSPGADRPFFKLSQFERFVGSKVTVNLYSAIDNRKRITGGISAVEGDVVVIYEQPSQEQPGREFRIPFQAISKARLAPEFDMNNGGRDGE